MSSKPTCAHGLSPRRLPPGQKRVFLFLQGHPSSFWPELADALTADGHRVLRVNLCLADQVFWGRRAAKNFRGRFHEWWGWLHNLLTKESVTDILYYADQLPYHRVARILGKKLGISCWAIEHGYLRPDWLTMEPGAMGAHSLFPKSRDDIERLAESQEPPNLNTLFTHGFPTEAFQEVTYNLLLAFGRPFFPWYWSDKVYWPAIEYLNWIIELALEPSRQRTARQLQKEIESGAFPFNLLAMQIQDDYQIRGSSDYDSLLSFLDEVMESLAGSAPSDRHLVVKIHPLDNGLERWFRRVPQIAEIHGLADRVHVIKGGDLGRFIEESEGVFVVNSTVGIHALRRGVPTYCAGHAVYNLKGLTHHGPLESFWTAPEKPEMDFYASFEKALTEIQIKGSFFDPQGRKHAIKEICARFGN